MNSVAQFGWRAMSSIMVFGDFCMFSARTLGWALSGAGRWRTVPLVLDQMFQVGTRSVPVVMVTGAFVGMVLAAQAILQFRAVGMEANLGAIVNLSVVRELGPVLAGVMLAGRVGGALAAELGTMRVTEQIDALRVMGADPLRVLVMPRFLACVLLLPVLVVYVDLTGVLGGYVIAVHVYDVNAAEFWEKASGAVQMFDIMTGLVKSVFFGAVISLICCYRGFRCEPGAAGVGRACTEGFVESCMAILAIDFFLGVLLNSIYLAMWGPPPVIM
jgi:phospholipid/cholesterol/gamma-HCH transport system permease protein